MRETNQRPANTGKRDLKDRYYTPRWCITGLIDRLAQVLPRMDEIKQPFEMVVDIGAGDGRIGIAVSQWLHYAHLELHLIEPMPPEGCGPEFDETPAKLADIKRVVTHAEDFQAMLDRGDNPWKDKRCLFVSNPPFSQSDEIVRRALNLLDNACSVGSWAFFLLRMDWRAAKSRANGIMNAHPMSLEFPLSPRPSFCVGASGSQTDFYNYAWHGWRSRFAPWVSGRWSWPIVRNE